MRSRPSSWLAATLCVLSLCAVSGADAQTPEDVRDAYQNADFEKAVRVTERIEQQGSLSREEYTALLEIKLLAQAALQDASAVDETLRALVELDRAHEFGPGIPPDLEARFKTLRAQAVGEPAISVLARPDKNDLVVSAELVGDAAVLFRHFEIAIAERRYKKVAKWPVRLAGQASKPSRIRVRAVGPAEISITEAEKTYRPPTTALDRAIAEPAPPQPAEEDGSSLTWWIVGAVAVVAVAGVTTTALVLSQEPDTRVGAPMFRSP